MIDFNVDKDKDKDKDKLYQIRVFDFLRQEFKLDKNVRLVIKFLWGINYRLNFWGKKDEDTIIEQYSMIDSKFVRVREVDGKFVAEVIK